MGVSFRIMKLLNTTVILSIAALSAVCGAHALTETEAESVLFMKQEEKLARDVYTHFATLYDIPVFSNIASAEQRHMDSVDYLIQANGLADTAPEGAGSFTIPELADLYPQLIAKGEQSLLDALEVGVLIEETDIEDLEIELQEATDTTLISIYNRLLRGSNNHLNAFNNAIASGGEIAETPALRMQGRANGQMLLGVNGGNCDGTATNLSIQSKTAGGKGPWRNAGGNANGVIVNDGAPRQFAVNQSVGNTIYRARMNSGTKATYSNEVCSQLLDTPWPDGEFLGQGWYATWMGDLFIGNYPLVYSDRFGWITIESFVDGELWFVDADGKKWMTTEDRYPWIYDSASGEWI